MLGGNSRAGKLLRKREHKDWRGRKDFPKIENRIWNLFGIRLELAENTESEQGFLLYIKP